MGSSGVHVLVVDDDQTMGRACARLLGRLGFEADVASNGEEALQLFDPERHQVVLTDLVMPGVDGLGLLRALVERSEDVQVVVMTGFGTIKSAVAAIKEGAANYITKPFDRDELEATLRPLVRQRSLEAEVSRLKVEIDAHDPAPELIGVSAAMRAVKDLIRAASRTLSPVFVYGPSGTGKELIARSIHRASDRRGGPFVPVNCGALPEGLAESELFGNVKGAFTGAGIAREGLFRSADRGTIFLDEIGEMPTELQVKLLRVLQESAVRPVGGTREQPVDVRVIAATNQPPGVAIEEQRLREDLYYRLAVLTIEVPPLAGRGEDVEALIQALLPRVRERYGRGPSQISAAALEVLRGHSWPGNVREVENVLDRVFAIREDDSEVRVADLPSSVRGGGLPGDSARSTPPRAEAPAPAPSAGAFSGVEAPKTLKDGEKILIRKALEEAGGNKTRAAKALGISRPLLYKRMKEYGIDL